jgi:predicted metal-dependent phosphoesterase TrpH
MLKGAIHIHSTYSDGEFTLAELREVFLAARCRFLCVTDHAEYFDQHKLQAYISECKSLSDERFHFVPSLEYTCDDKMHILGYGTTALVNTRDPQTVIRHIDKHGGISVIAHPRDESFSWIESFETLPRGIETWNTKYDGRYAPRPQTFTLLQRLRGRHSSILAFYGQDLHWKQQHRGLFIELDCTSATDQSILDGFASGTYQGRKGDLTLPSSGQLPDAIVAKFSKAHTRAARISHFLKKSKTLLDRAGVKAPAPLKAQLRKIF